MTVDVVMSPVAYDGWVKALLFIVADFFFSHLCSLSSLFGLTHCTATLTPVVLKCG
jgi:hypothetical protein